MAGQYPTPVTGHARFSGNACYVIMISALSAILLPDGYTTDAVIVLSRQRVRMDEQFSVLCSINHTQSAKLIKRWHTVSKVAIQRFHLCGWETKELLAVYKYRQENDCRRKKIEKSYAGEHHHWDSIITGGTNDADTLSMRINITSPGAVADDTGMYECLVFFADTEMGRSAEVLKVAYGEPLLSKKHITNGDSFGILCRLFSVEAAQDMTKDLRRLKISFTPRNHTGVSKIVLVDFQAYERMPPRTYQNKNLTWNWKVESIGPHRPGHTCNQVVKIRVFDVDVKVHTGLYECLVSWIPPGARLMSRAISAELLPVGAQPSFAQDVDAKVPTSPSKSHHGSDIIFFSLCLAVELAVRD